MQNGVHTMLTVNGNNGIIGSERERTFMMVKPEGVSRGLVGSIIKRFENKGFKLIALKFMYATPEQLMSHYEEHANAHFFPDLIKYLSSGPIVPMVWEGHNVIHGSRLLIGKTNPMDSLPGTIRGDFCTHIHPWNIVHGSDSVPAAKREINLWFRSDEIVNWKWNNDPWCHLNNY